MSVTRIRRAAWEQREPDRGGIAPVHTLVVTPFGVMLRRLRIASGLSQNALARGASVDPAYVNACERRGKLPRREVVLRLADTLDCPEVDRDALLIAAGCAPVADWMGRALAAENALDRVLTSLRKSGGQP